MKFRDLRPVGVSWIVTIALLLIATWYNVLAKGELGIVGVIFSASMAVYLIAHLAWTRDR